MTTHEYLQQIQTKLSTGDALEHSYRGIFEQWIHTLAPEITIINEPKRSKFGRPDFVFHKGGKADLKIGYAETKDLDIQLSDVENSEQIRRYAGYSNFLLTNYLDFWFYRNGVCEQKIIIGKAEQGLITQMEEGMAHLESALRMFLDKPPEQITSGKRLAQIMGTRAQLIRENIRIFLHHTENEKNEEIEKIFQTMQELLVHDLTVEQFADMYAQTLVYGLFVARFHDKTPETFTRQEAPYLVPPSNPFLQQFFDHIAGPKFDDRLSYIVEDLCRIFAVSNVAEIVIHHLNLFGEAKAQDPIIHFYEDFLKEYDPALRKQMGAYYTPVPIVQYIVNSIDELIIKEFGLPQGLADTAKTQYVAIQGKIKSTHVTPKVQILDPAVGTATFLNETIKYIHSHYFVNQKGVWPSYVQDELIPRLYGFELMMAPYTIAHLKLTMTLKDLGIEDFTKRLGVYLTNTLEEGIRDDGGLFPGFGFIETITNEAKEAGRIKHERPIMVIMGNPPYSGVSSNETAYANSLVQKYKVEPGGKQKLQERKHWLNDDYVKFIAFAEEMIAKNGSGIVGMITNNGYLDNPTFRGMRWHLAKTFDKLYVLDLHGNAKKKERAPDGGRDENVFPIMQGVGIVLAVKTGNKKPGALADVYHAELFGTRIDKFEKLQKGNMVWNYLTLDRELMYFVPKNRTGEEEYKKGISIEQLFLQNVTGIVTMGDNFIVHENKDVIQQRICDLLSNKYDEYRLNEEFGLGKNYASFVIKGKHQLVFDHKKLIKLNYRPFDDRWTYFDNKVLWRWREQVMRHMVYHKNISFAVPRQAITNNWSHIQVVDSIIDNRVHYSNKGISIQIPLYLYHDDGTRTSNFNPEEYKKLLAHLSHEVAPEDAFDYIYGILHSPRYRKTYQEFLKVDFPRIPTPKDNAQFNHFARYGKQLRELHLMTSPLLNTLSTTFPQMGTNIVEKVEYLKVSTEHALGNVWINTTQYVGNVPKEVWDFYIGGYQPAQKWLKDRKGKILTYEDITHYQRIIAVLVETHRIMQEIDK